jgi:glycerol kinase
MASADKFVLALDQGTTSSRAILFGRDGRPVASAQREFPQLFPSPGHVEHNPEAIWSSQLSTAKEAISQAGITPQQIDSIGVTNQRETTILWDRKTGQPVANAIVWQSRITSPVCDKLKEQGLEPLIREKTGLVIDAYFSATKIAHLLDAITGLRSRAEKGEILFGTVDSFLVWKLTSGRLHITDVSNASRTLLFNIHTLDWDEELLKVFNVPRSVLPHVRSSSEVYGKTDRDLFGAEIPIAGIAGDQQAATFGQACFQPGAAKNTYGTGCFLLLNTGNRPATSKHGLITTIGWKIGKDVTYCLEGAIFVAGAAVQWLRTNLGFIEKSSDIEALAASVKSNGGVYLVPAFVGLGAPYWDSEARGAIVGLTRGSSKEHIARAALEAMAYQTRDVLDAMQADSGVRLSSLRVDGGATANNLLMQFQADVLDTPVLRPVVQETTALGAAYLAGLATGYWTDQADLTKNWVLDREFRPDMAADNRNKLYDGWKHAVRQARA